MFDAFGLEYLTLDSILEDIQYPSPDDFDDPTSVTHASADVSQFALATLRKFHRKYHVDPIGEHKATYNRFLQSALRLAAATDAVIENNDVHVILGHDDKYIYGGVPLAVSAAQGVPAYSHSLGYQDQTMLISNISHRSSFPQYELPELVDDELQVPLTGEQSSQIDDLMSGRASGETTRHMYSSISDRGVAANQNQEVVAGVFTNLIWDASLEGGDGPFADVFNWIETTIESAANYDSLSLVVKCHPAEAKRGTNESVSEWIRRRFDPLPENVEVLPPDTDVDTYQMISELDAGFVYNSTVGLEMAYEGVPVVVGGDTHYSGLGFTFDPEDVQSYTEIFSKLTDLEMDDEMENRARRYAYFLFFQKHHPFDFYQTNQETLQTELLPVTSDDIAPASDTFDFIVDQCLNDEPVFYSRCEDAPRNRRMNTTAE
jgi:hypothetical protein